VGAFTLKRSYTIFPAAYHRRRLKKEYMRPNSASLISDLSALTGHLDEKLDLTFEQAEAAARLLASETVDPLAKEAFLKALAAKGETGTEIAAFAKTFRGLSRDPKVEKWAARAVDVCGTGGDKMGSFNISTAVMFILAAGGIPVFKHGNRSITSQCGSADLLAALGIPMEAEDSLLHKSLDELNFAFFFAPQFHPAFKTIMPVRRALAKQGQRSVFNILGPLINPGRPAFQLLGVYSQAWMEVLATALDSMKLRNGYIVHCRLNENSGFDELSCVGVNHLVGFGESRDRKEEWEAKRFGLPEADISELAGGDAEENLALFYRVIDGTAPTGLINSIVLNAAVAFATIGETASVEEGIERARDLLSSGEVKKHVARTSDFYRS